jgi:2-dehydro-3-deoxyphosphogluconate aldolase/(4S)-4-hydroxy-2-oxoglutarate aldolase
MAKFTREQVYTEMKGTGLVPLFYDADITNAKAIVKACYDGGARVLEFVVRGDFSEAVFEELNVYTINNLEGMMLGVGSVTDAAQASRYMALGANFIITPVFREDIAKVCNRRKVMWSPGCGSLTEIAIAEELGCQLVKLFPGNIYGPGFVKAVKGPQPWTNIMPTGGVSPNKDNLNEWFNAGVDCVGMGSKLIKKDANGNYDYGFIENTVKETLAIITALRN